MFNKPALFPKAPDPLPPRSGTRVGAATLAAGPASTASSPMRAMAEPGAPAGSVNAATGDEAVSASVPPQGEQVDNAGHESGSRLIVGPDVKLKGAEILDCDTLVVEGRVEATMDSRVIRIAVNGSFSGTVGIDVAEVYGRFEGELTARSQLIIHATGRVSGKIRYGKILIEEGGEISGDVQSLAAAKDSGREPVRTLVREESPVKVAVSG